nr:E3 ubiquitin protein ligase DRIP2-like isoform X1 [Ipomoea batatas]GMD20074.1 E3 ubiquitin protein ligase DRIP2-like isoform X1 [Ipomoea batatas]
MTCPLCNKLFRDATTISECLHTCKSLAISPFVCTSNSIDSVICYDVLEFRIDGLRSEFARFCIVLPGLCLDLLSRNLDTRYLLAGLCYSLFAYMFLDVEL